VWCAAGSSGLPLAVSTPQPPVALYLHLPFCVAHCPYCDFVVYAGSEARGPRARTGRLYEAVGRELEMRADALDELSGRPHPGGPPRPAERGRPHPGGRPNVRGPRRPLDSVYFGGGTPSLVPGSGFERLMSIVRRRYGLAPDAEVTLEANPGPDERGDLAAFAAAGVNRVSFERRAWTVLSCGASVDATPRGTWPRPWRRHERLGSAL